MFPNKFATCCSLLFIFELIMFYSNSEYIETLLLGKPNYMIFLALDLQDAFVYRIIEFSRYTSATPLF
jgi:hypothetical protein